MLSYVNVPYIILRRKGDDKLLRLRGLPNGLELTSICHFRGRYYVCGKYCKGFLAYLDKMDEQESATMWGVKAAWGVTVAKKAAAPIRKAVAAKRKPNDNATEATAKSFDFEQYQGIQLYVSDNCIDFMPVELPKEIRNNYLKINDKRTFDWKGYRDISDLLQTDEKRTAKLYYDERHLLIRDGNRALVTTDLENWQVVEGNCILKDGYVICIDNKNQIRVSKDAVSWRTVGEVPCAVYDFTYTNGRFIIIKGDRSLATAIVK